VSGCNRVARELSTGRLLLGALSGLVGLVWRNPTRDKGHNLEIAVISDVYPSDRDLGAATSKNSSYLCYAPETPGADEA